MRIVLIVTQLEGGGAQMAAMRLAAELRRRGHSAESWFLYRKRSTLDGVPHVRALWNEPPRTPWAIVRLLGRLARAFRRFNPDAVLSFTHYANIISQPLALACGVQGRVASQRNPPSSYPRAARVLDRWLGSTPIYRINIAVSDSVADAFADHPTAYRKKIRVVRNGLDAPAGEPAAATQPAGDPLRPVILSVGRLATQKNHAVLVRALPQIPAARLVIAGGGELQRELSALSVALGVEDRVELIGEVPPARVATLLQSADVFALPSLFEGHSNATLEAARAGLPIVVSDIPPQRELLSGYDGTPAGLLLDPHDVAAWSAALARLCGNPSERALLASRSLALGQVFTMAAMCDGFEDAIRATGAGRHSRGELSCQLSN